MKTVCKKLLCLMLVAMLLVSAVPAAFATETCQHVFSGKPTVKTAATCTTPGVLVQTCANEGCNATSEIQVAALGHNFSGKPTVKTAATCTTPGVLVQTCSNPGCTETSETSVAALGHNYENQVVAPTCTEGGYSKDVCKVCGDVKNETTTAARGHNIENGFCTECDYKDPTAEAGLIITIYKWQGNDRTQIGEITLPAGVYTLDDEFAASAYPAQKIKYDWGSRNGMVVDATKEKINVALSVTPLETSGGKNVYKLRVYANDGTSNYKQIDIYEGEGILAAIKNAGITPKYEDHVLVGYLNNHTGNASTYLTIYDVADGDDANSDGVIKVYADWRKETDDDDEDFEYGEGGGLYGDENGNPIYDAVLYIYTNGKTSSYAKKVSASSLGKHTKDGVLSRDEVELVVENYFKTYDDTKYYGLFTKYYWNEGNYLTENAKYEIELDPDETTAVYVMVKNAKAYVADSSNPKTGDDIMIAVTTMGLTAAALVSLVELKKRKMI